MKKMIPLMLVLCLLAAAPAQAETDLTGRPIANGVISAPQFTDITAPFSGTLTSFTLKAGDTVAPGQALLGFVTTDLYAPEAGTVQAVFVTPGDDAAAVMARYGALAGIEPDTAYQVKATTAGGDKSNDNKILHLGETLYFKTSGSNASEGSGRVVAVSGEAYTVDVLAGDFDVDASVTLYRRDNYASTSSVGKGDLVRRAPLSIGGSGRVAAVAVAEGARVQAGDYLLSLVAADATPSAYQSQVESPVSGVVEAVYAAPGQQVWKGAALCRIRHTDTLDIKADVDEADLHGLSVGDLLPATLDASPQIVLMATVREISALGYTKQNAAYFTVYATIPAGSGMLGASASLYLPAETAE